LDANTTSGDFLQITPNFSVGVSVSAESHDVGLAFKPVQMRFPSEYSVLSFRMLLPLILQEALPLPPPTWRRLYSEMGGARRLNAKATTPDEGGDDVRAILKKNMRDGYGALDVRPLLAPSAAYTIGDGEKSAVLDAVDPLVITLLLSWVGKHKVRFFICVCSYI
jgi:hypothetical protein